jgi:hypothetical protein
LYCDSLFAGNLSIKRRTGPNCIFRCFNAIQKFVSVDLKNSGPVKLPPVILDHIGLLRKDCLRSLVVHRSLFIEARVRIKADATIQATKWAHTDGAKEIFFEWAIPMRAVILNATAIWTLSFFGHVRLLWRYIFVRGIFRSQQRRLISQGAVCCEEGAAGC